MGRQVEAQAGKCKCQDSETKPVAKLDGTPGLRPGAPRPVATFSLGEAFQKPSVVTDAVRRAVSVNGSDAFRHRHFLAKKKRGRSISSFTPSRLR
jgi:hypothetical protein